MSEEDDRLTVWHNRLGGGLSLLEVLYMSEEKYKLWVEDPERYLKERKDAGSAK